MLGLEDLTYAQGVTNDEFMAVLSSLNQFQLSA